MRALVLSGGHALGAYQAGAWEALSEFGFEPDWVAGCSIGAINGALILGGRPDGAAARLRRFWEVAASPGVVVSDDIELRKLANAASAAQTLLLGRPGLFWPRFPEALAAARPALYGRGPLQRTLSELVDFDALNAARFSLQAVDLESGEPRLFETPRDRVGPEHLLASSAYLPDFEPIEIEGRRYADGGHAINAPIDAALMRAPNEPTAIVLVDLFSRAGAAPATPDAALERRQSLTFSNPVHLALALAARIPRGAPAVVLHLAFRTRPHELATRGYDYSRQTLAERWTAGREEAARLLSAPDVFTPEPGQSVTVRRLD